MDNDIKNFFSMPIPRSVQGRLSSNFHMSVGIREQNLSLFEFKLVAI